MNTMNTNLKAMMGAAMMLLLLGTTGCRTMEPRAPSIETSVMMAAFFGTHEVLNAVPEWRPHFERAVEELLHLEATERFTAATVLDILRRLPVDELQSDRAHLYFGLATILIEDAGGIFDLEQFEDARPIVAALRRGMQEALRH